ncbi:DUF2238 domain-containing protein [Candidatus Peregrinibacteria bacterium]|nr:DUF2238 domain-containing protein [Candidatus Peregrinibacteria bacterium]
MSLFTVRNELWYVTLFTLSYLAIGSMFALQIENWEFILYIAVILLLGLAVLTLHARVRFTQGVLWLLSVWGLFHLLGGLLTVSPVWPIDAGAKPVLYNLWLIPYVLKYDHVMHLYGFGICTWVCWQMLRSIMPRNLRHPLELVIAILASNGLGAWNEIVEFLAVMWIPDNNVGGYVNTGLDLVSNLIGSLIAACIIWYGRVPHRRTAQVA